MKEFKQQFLYKDQDGINAQTIQIESAAAALNGFILEAETVLGCKFTDKEKQSLKSNGKEFIKDLVQTKFTFQNANEDFNLEALGLTKVKDLYSNYDKNSGKWIYFDYTLTKGVFVASESEKEKTIQSFSTFSQNQKQNDVLILAEKMVSLFDEAQKMGVLTDYGRKHISSVFDVLTVDVHPEIGEYRIMVNKRFLNSKYLN
jgi:hypothetical protein